MIEGPKKTVSITIPMEEYEELSTLAKESSRRLPAYIRQVLRAHLDYVWRLSVGHRR